LGVLLEFLIKVESSFNDWFDFNNSDEKEMFELLRKAYVDARYNSDYKITKRQLKFLEKKVLFLRDEVERLCDVAIKG